MTRRETFLRAGLDQMGAPYRWDGKGIPFQAAGLYEIRGRDCSGLVTFSLVAAGGPDKRSTWNAEIMWDVLPAPLGAAMPGDLCLYGHNGAISHVMVVLGVGDLVFGAAGGDHTTTTETEAIRRGACVQIWGSHDPYPSALPFAGYRRIPWLDEIPPVA